MKTKLWQKQPINKLLASAFWSEPHQDPSGPKSRMFQKSWCGVSFWTTTHNMSQWAKKKTSVCAEWQSEVLSEVIRKVWRLCLLHHHVTLTHIRPSEHSWPVVSLRTCVPGLSLHGYRNKAFRGWLGSLQTAEGGTRTQDHKWRTLKKEKYIACGKKIISMNRCSITQHDHRDGKKEERRRKTEIMIESESENKRMKEGESWKTFRRGGRFICLL